MWKTYLKGLKENPHKCSFWKNEGIIDINHETSFKIFSVNNSLKKIQFFSKIKKVLSIFKGLGGQGAQAIIKKIKILMISTIKIVTKYIWHQKAILNSFSATKLHVVFKLLTRIFWNSKYWAYASCFPSP